MSWTGFGSNVCHDYNNHLFLLLVLVNVVLDPSQHIQADGVTGIVHQNKCVRVGEVVLWQLEEEFLCQSK